MVKYTDAQKAAYYKKKYQDSQKKKSYSGRSYYKKRSYTPRKGKYDYPGLGRSIGSAAGNMIAPGIGGSIGGAMGHGAQSLMKTITGFGDYNVSANSMVYNSDAVPQFTHQNPRCTIITHREFIKDIRSSINFESSVFTINPGDPLTFPWLHKIAANYEEYLFQGIIFEYKTNSATSIGSTNTALGTVAIATQYNSLAPSFTSKQQIENYEFANSSVPSQSMLHALECDPKLGNEVKYIFNERDSDVNADPRNYNLGKTTIATQGMQAASTVGELWVSYKVCLLKPRLGYDDNIADCYQMRGNIAATTPLGDEPLLASLKNVGFTRQIIDGVSDNKIEFNEAFNGIVRVEVIYNPLAVTDSFQPPDIVVAGGNISDVSTSYLGVDKGRSTTVFTDSVYWISYFQVEGGFNSSGVLPTIAVSGMTTVGTTFTNPDTNCYINIMAVPSQSVFPEY